MPEDSDKDARAAAKKAALQQKLLDQYRQYLGLTKEQLEAENLSADTIGKILKLQEGLTGNEKARINLKKTALSIDALGIKGEAARQLLSSSTSRNQQASIIGMAQYQARLQNTINTAEKGSSIQIEAQKELDKLKKRHLSEAISGSTEEGRAKAKGIKASAPSSATKLTEDVGIVGAIARRSLMGLADAEKEAGEHGVQMSFGQQLASTGIEKLAGTFGPLLSNLTLASGAFGIAAVAIQALIGGIDQTNKTAAPGLASLSQAGISVGAGLGEISKSAAAMNLAVIDAFNMKGISPIIPDTITSGVDPMIEMLPVAQNALRGVAYGAGATTKSIASMQEGMTEVAAAGVLNNMTMEESTAMGVRMQRAFNLSSKDGKDVSSTFQRMAKSAGAAGLTVNELVGSMMDMGEAGKSYGDQSAMYEKMAAAMVGMGLAANTAKMQMMAGVATKFMGMSLGQQIGITMAANKGLSIGGAVSAYQRITTGPNGEPKKGGGITDLFFENMKGIMKNFGLGKQMAGGREGLFNAAETLGGIFQSEELKKSILNSKDVRDALMGTGAGNPKANQEALKKLEEAMKVESNPIAAGAQMLGLNKGVIEKFQLSLELIARHLGTIAASKIMTWPGWSGSPSVPVMPNHLRSLNEQISAANAVGAFPVVGTN